MNKIHQSNLSFYVSLGGSDENIGTAEQPFATISRAQEAIRQIKQPDKSSITVFVREGTYYLVAPILFEMIDSGNTDGLIRYTAHPGEKVTLSGGRKLECDWVPYKAGIWRCEIPEARDGKLVFDQLFVNGKRQILARYPNADATDPKNFSGYIQALGKIGDDIPDPQPGPNDDMAFSGAAPRGILFDPANFTKARWHNPSEAVIHIYQSYYWGNLQWQIKDIEWDNQRIWFGDGGQQMGAKWSIDPCNVNEHSMYYIENVFEEIDAPGEWYLDKTEGFLYYFPDENVDLASAIVEIPILDQIVQFKGTQQNPVHHIVLDGFRFTHTASTFLKSYTIPSLSDWSIHCGGSVYLEGTRDCFIENCFFDAVGGNAVFMRNYNRGNSVTGCAFMETGDSAICFVGSLETTVGNQRNFSYQCRADNNLIHDCGAFGKQIAGVYISRAKRITVSHNEIYNMPRAGICIGDGTWGGHVIEYNYIHDT
ncbi:MAG: right-handed parallel beta-helix repeat-containing protein, partial [Anaerolineaceae bacterium]|nr:right-handed parallel beta-helix repeat-containing protein [Anaerolineaceae bacterium]